VSRAADDPIMRVRNLRKHYPITEGVLREEVGRVRAVDGISFDLRRGETLGIVGESGCGKSTAAEALIRLEEPTGGEILFEGEDVTAYGDRELKRFRRRVQMVFQDPDSSFDPRMSVGDAVAEPLVVQGMDDRTRRREIVADLLERVGLSAADAERYPHEFSGGQKQRIGLARALAVNPDVIIADEPVSALDVSIQSEILGLMDRLQAAFGLTVVVISHNLSVVREICDRVAVMYLGEFVEVGPTDRLFADPKHPYTRALLSAIPTPDPSRRGLGTELKGDVPDPSDPPPGCRFHTRCPAVIPPQGLDLDQDVWRRVLRFRQRVRDGGVDAAAVAAVAGADDAGPESDDAAPLDGIDPATVDARFREEYDLPPELSDPAAEAALAAGFERLANGEIAAADAALSERFTTPCEREPPALRDLSPDHRVACFLHEEQPPAADGPDGDRASRERGRNGDGTRNPTRAGARASDADRP
jgi:peptide/nickel transport system ATP-binding protein